MNTYTLEVTLVSGLISFGDLDSSYGSDSSEAFDYYFRNFGGTELLYDASPCLNDDSNALPEDNSLTDLYWNSDTEVFDGATPNYEIKSVSGDLESGWEYDYHLLLVFSAQISAPNLDAAVAGVRSEVLDYLAIYDGGSDDVFEIDEVRVTEKK